MGEISPQQCHLLSRYVSCCYLLSPSHISSSTQPSCLHLSVCLCAGQSLTSVKVKAGEALRLHSTSVGEEAREEDEGAEESREGGGESGETDLSGSGESSASAAASGRGVFSTITHAVQNTVSEHTHTHTALSTSPSYRIIT